MYRITRNPFVLFALAPAYVFLVQQRFSSRAVGKRERRGVYWTNGALAAIAVLMSLTIGIKAYALIQLPVIVFAAATGVWLFYVQHQFEDTYWARQDGWSFHAGALQGATHYDLPGVLRWFTANIGIHHVHHLASRIPSYRLREALAEHPELRDVGRLTLRQSLKCFRLALWNEESRKLVAFRDLRTLA